MTNFVGSVYELFCSKPKICNGFWKTNSEPEPNNQLSDSYHKLVIRHPQAGNGHCRAGNVPEQRNAARSVTLIPQGSLSGRTDPHLLSLMSFTAHTRMQ